ncbi:hypothetical protein EPN44_00180 [bacterium]|nr:MAG: hypothetical protein EPN44_00180 [bacterium]
MKRPLQVAIALAPGCVLLIAASLIASDGAPRPARAAAAISARRPSTQLDTARAFVSPPLGRDPFAPPPGARGDEPPPPPPTQSAPHNGTPAALPILRAVVVGERSVALLDIGGGTVLAHEGDPAGAWRVAVISAGTAHLVRAGAELTLRVEERL